MAPLKSNARETLNRPWNLLGFATAQIKRQKENLALRIVWIYLIDREKPPYRYYEPAYLIKIPYEENDDLWNISTPYTSKYFDVFEQFFESSRLQHPKELLSPVGHAEVKVVRDIAAGIDHPIIRKEKERVAFIESQHSLWDQPHLIVEKMRKLGLYSSKSDRLRQVWTVKGIIKKLKTKSD